MGNGEYYFPITHYQLAITKISLEFIGQAVNSILLNIASLAAKAKESSSFVKVIEV
jgi:hypothetical protein